VLLEGGGKINGSFLRAGLIDELSLVYEPIADGSMGTPSLFDVAHDRSAAVRLNLLSCMRLRRDRLWVRYAVRPSRER
jgi:riboflavin biosynthesis pyrimidine reductase